MRHLIWTEPAIADMYARGFGTGKGKDYQPWIHVQDFSSNGRVRRYWGTKAQRMHHVLSDVERNLLATLEWAQDVVEIWEQYPIQRSITTAVAGALGIPHPYYPSTNILTVMTVDFLVTRVRDGKLYLQALDAKDDDESEDEDSVSSLEIMRTVFEESDIKHATIYRSSMSAIEVQSIEWIRVAMLDKHEQHLRTRFDDYMASMTRALGRPGPDVRLHEFCTAFDESYGLDPGTGIRVARMLMESRVLIPNLDCPDLSKAHMSTFQLSAMPGKPRLVGVK